MRRALRAWGQEGSGMPGPRHGANGFCAVWAEGGACAPPPPVRIEWRRNETGRRYGCGSRGAGLESMPLKNARISSRLTGR